AALLLGSFRKLTQVNPGFDRSGVLLVAADFTHARTGTEQQLIAERQLLDGLQAIPGARAVGSSLFTPISGSGWNDFVLVNAAKRPEKGKRQTIPWFNQVSAGYFHTMGMTLVAGRDIAPTDGPTTPLVAVVDEAIVHQYFTSVSPLGQTFRTPVGDTTSAPVTIVGVVETAKYRSLTEDSPGTIYLPFGQGDGGGTANVAYELRANGSPTTLIPAVKAAAAQLSPGITLDFTTLSDQLSASLARPRVLATLSGFFGALALLLAMIGLYGTISYDVTRRRNEIGVRIALGAVGARVVRMVIGDAGRLILLGIALGLALAFATTRFVSSFLFGLTATDPTTMVLAALALGLVAIGAALVPAWRAARVDPMDALREE
ncbi:MAG TPA: FtsX-like permease family protein, partial [Gemmatimonadaceae bacterium]